MAQRLIECECGYSYYTDKKVSYCKNCGERHNTYNSDNIIVLIPIFLSSWYKLYYFKDRQKWDNAYDWAAKLLIFLVVWLLLGFLLLIVLFSIFDSFDLDGIWGYLIFNIPIGLLFLGPISGIIIQPIAFILNKLYQRK